MDNVIKTSGTTEQYKLNPGGSISYPFAVKGIVKQNVDTIRSEYIRVYNNAVFSSGVFSKTLSAPETFALGDGIIPPSTARTTPIN